MDLIKFKPILKTMLWGGEKIVPYKQISSDQHQIGESWELSGVKGDESIVANGEYEGLTLPSLIAVLKDKLVGKANYKRFGLEFPLLIKFIDAQQDLS
ncbi:MAG: mannose-6-phosphate isomerase, partial [Alistipes sp.]